MKHFLIIVLLAIMTIPTHAKWTTPSNEVRQNVDGHGVTAKVVDRRKDPEGAQNRYGYIDFTCRGLPNTTVNWRVYGDGKLVDEGQIVLPRKGHKEAFDYGEPFGVVGYTPKIKEYTVSIEIVVPEKVELPAPATGWTKISKTVLQDKISVSVTDRRKEKSGPICQLSFWNTGDVSHPTIEYKIYCDNIEVEEGEVTLKYSQQTVDIESFNSIFATYDTLMDAKNVLISIHVK